MNKSFFEYLGMANLERVHSQIIAWFLSQDCKALNANQKNYFLRSIVGKPEIGEIESIETEVNDMDILIKTNTRNIIIIENKLKSGQHSNQLNRYQNYCEKFHKDYTKYYLYLTLLGENSKHNDWINVSYCEIYNCLKELVLVPGVNDSYILKEYYNFLGRLTEVITDFEGNPQKYRRIFYEGGLSKINRKQNMYELENEMFISSNRLETILQKGYLIKLLNKVNHSDCNVGETRGCALLDLYLNRNIKIGDRRFLTMIELQGNTIKFAITLEEGYEKSNKSLLRNAVQIMASISKLGLYNYNKFNVPKKKAYVSISKKLKKNYWDVTEDEFYYFINQELENGKELSSKFMELLSTNTKLETEPLTDALSILS